MANTDLRQGFHYIEVRLANLAKNATEETDDRAQLDIEFNLLVDEMKRTQSLYGIKRDSLSILDSEDNVLTLPAAERVHKKLALLSL